MHYQLLLDRFEEEDKRNIFQGGMTSALEETGGNPLITTAGSPGISYTPGAKNPRVTFFAWKIHFQQSFQSAL
ncbi:hypothetical protein H5410_053567 [Solanum commersonii]|uniref:Uncharacterized protein n=1 Tax=Solanum commersonii TaxID=4109 RepID=A0A9J5X6P9_SOLCO|nr:hypothetical protein H5410_053567 [Solanum commersonii]